MALKRFIVILFLLAIYFLMVYKMLDIPTKWAVAFILASTILIMILVTRNPKTVLLVLLAFSIPLNADFYLFRRLEYAPTGVGGVTVSIVDVCVLILLLIWMLNSLTNTYNMKIPFSKISPPTTSIILFFLVCVVSTFISFDLLGTLHLIALAKSCILYIYIAKNLESKKEILLIIGALASATIFEAVLVGIQEISGVGLGLQVLGEGFVAETGQRGMGTFYSPNSMALLFLDFHLPLFLVMYLSKIHIGKIYRAYLLFAFSSGTLALILTRSRGGWIALCFAIVTIFLLMRGRRNVNLQRSRIRLSILLLGVFLLVVRFSHIIVPRVLHPTEDEVKSAEIRIPLMKVAYNMIKAQPVLGVGIGHYLQNMSSYDNTRENVTAFFGSRVHNLYLLLAAELGLLGLFAFLWIVVLLYKVGLQLARSGDPLIATAAVGITVGFSAFFIHCMVDSPNALSAVTNFWFFSGFLVGLKGLDL